MPSATYPLPDQNILFVHCSGFMEPKDVIGWQVEDQIGVSGALGFVTLVDLSDVTGTDMTFDDLNAVYGQLVRHYQPRKQRLTLLLYAPDDLTFGMTRIMQSLSGMTDHVTVQVFRKAERIGDHLPDLTLGFFDLRAKALSSRGCERSPCSAGACP
ncbi:hypothetical protein [Cognatishimia maritima]|uniref:Uncharacterized protein n=1 Tax=Cognatishimia maritima TaxID=870908 RepID=A0A1M5JCX2_9RHOB|nr:hypothetical protein [Cognatishimia maritima]SHG38351.1 hypothetical protein SAMN04488044_0616 [Cognatishimia maritima]